MDVKILINIMRLLLISFIITVIVILVALFITPAFVVRSWIGKWDWSIIKKLYKFLWES